MKNKSLGRGKRGMNEKEAERAEKSGRSEAETVVY